MNINNAIYFDTETLSLNPNKKENKMVLVQFGKIVNNKLIIETFNEWNNNEEDLLSYVINYINKLPKYTPIFTYNGEFDFRYFYARLRYNNTSDNDYYMIHEAIIKMKHCDVLQYDNGYFVSLDTICNKYDIETENNFSGIDVKWQYEEGDYKAIISHGIDDIKRLYRLINETNLADRFYKIQVLKTKW